MRDMFPVLEGIISEAQKSLLGLAFVLIVFGIIWQIWSSDYSYKSLMHVIIRFVIVAFLIANSKVIFKGAEDFFLRIADVIQPGYYESPFSASAAMLEPTEEKKQGILSALFGVGVYHSLFLAIAHLVVKLCLILIAPFLVLQFFLVQLAFLMFPVMISLCMHPSLVGKTMHYVKGTLSLMAWPIGFAATSLLALGLLHQFNDPSFQPAFQRERVGQMAGGLIGTEAHNMGAPMIAALIMIVGILSTPTIMYQLITAGGGLMEAVGKTIGMGKAAAGMAVSGGIGAVKLGAQGVAAMGKCADNIASQVGAPGGGGGGGSSSGAKPWMCAKSANGSDLCLKMDLPALEDAPIKAITSDV